MDPVIANYLDRQDQLITRAQALEALSLGSLRHQLVRSWAIVLPGVYAAFTGALTDRQRKRACLLYGGPLAQLADVTALRDFGVRYLPENGGTEVVHLLIPAEDRRASQRMVVVRRTYRLPRPQLVAGLPYCPVERSLVEAAARIGDRRAARAMMADAVQRGLAVQWRLIEEIPHLSGRGSNVVRRTLDDLALGGRSAPEMGFLDLVADCATVPMPLANPLVELPDGRRVSPDGLWPDARLVHETNGRGPHAGHDEFTDMQARHDAMTAAGLIVLHNTPRQIRTEGHRIMSEVAACYQRNAGRGLPAGVTILRTSPSHGT
jgi:hypothetical protein